MEGTYVDEVYFCVLMLRYSDLVGHSSAQQDVPPRIATASIMSTDMYSEVRDLYIKAAQRAPGNDIDPTVQVLKNCCSIPDLKVCDLLSFGKIS